MAVLEIPSFSESRWCALSHASKALSLALSLGYKSLVQHAVDRKAVTVYASSGFTTMTPMTRRFALVCALATMPAEALLAELMTDQCVPARLSQLKTLVCEEVDELERIDTEVWTLLARISDQHYDELRHEVLTGARTSVAYVYRK
eukprot:848223-Amphidinium_carterae.1